MKFRFCQDVGRITRSFKVTERDLQSPSPIAGSLKKGRNMVNKVNSDTDHKCMPARYTVGQILSGYLLKSKHIG